LRNKVAISGLSFFLGRSAPNTLLIIEGECILLSLFGTILAKIIL
jgi:hypothetical protein